MEPNTVESNPQHQYNQQFYSTPNYYYYQGYDMSAGDSSYYNHGYFNYPPCYNYPQYQQQATELPVRTNTPDKPIMNDSGLGASPEFMTNAASSVNDTVSEDDENEETPRTKSSNSSSMLKPPKPYLEIIADAILTATDHMMQLHEIYQYMETKFAYFGKNVNKTWRNSVRHNLSLNECFVKAGRGNNGKGNFWKIHSACKPDFMRGNFRRKNFKLLIKQTTRQPKTETQIQADYNPIHSLNFINNQIKSFGIENFFNVNQLKSYENNTLKKSNYRYQPY